MNIDAIPGLSQGLELLLHELEEAIEMFSKAGCHCRTRELGAPANKGGAIATGQITSGFLWKPVSDSDGKLAILLPESYSKEPRTAVRVLDPSGRTELARGAPKGAGNGNRLHFRFNRPGSAFPEGSIVEIIQPGGKTERIRIDDTSKRIEGRR